MKYPLVQRSVFLTLSVLFAGGISGCGEGTPKTVTVSGTITLDGGEWPAPCSLYFMAVQPANGFPRESGIAELDKDGRFVAKTIADEFGLGLLPGHYQVAVNCWAEPYRMDAGPPRKSHVPEKYRNAATSGLKVLVNADSDGPITVSWNVPAPVGKR